MNARRNLSDHVAATIRESKELDFHRWAVAAALLFYIFDMARPTTMGHRGMTVFFCQSWLSKRSSLPAPWVGVPDGNDVISCRVIRQWLNCYYSPLHFLLSLIDHVHITTFVRFYRFNTDISAPVFAVRQFLPYCR